MTQYYARTDVSYSGGDKLFSITFPYIKKEHIKVFVNGELTDNYTYITASQIRIDDELELDDEISIRRTTPIDERMVVFSDTSILNKDAQNLDSDQLFDVVQEIYDNNTSFKFDTTEQIENIEAKADDALQNVEEAISIANTAETKADNAISIANTASDNADTAISIANSADTSAQSAVSAANSATVAANRAVLTANDAKDIAEGAESIALSSKERVDEFDASITAVLDAAEQIEELHSAVDDAIEAAEAAQQAAASLVIDDELDDTSEQPVQNKVVKAAIDAKQDELESGTNIKTIGNQSIIGSGNIDIKTVDSQSIIGSGNIDIQSIIEQNSNEKTKLWMGTYAQYLAISGAVAIKYYLEVPNALECYIVPSTIDTTTPHSTTIYNADGTVMSLSGYQGIYNLYKYINTDNNSEVWTTTLVDDSNNPFNNQLLNQILPEQWQRNRNITISSRPTANTIIASDGYTYSLTDEQYISQGANIYVLSQNNINNGIRLYYQYPQYITIGNGDTSLYDENTIYICTDTGSIYKGTTPIITNSDDKVSKSGDTMTGSLSVQTAETGTNDNAFIHLSSTSLEKGTNPTGTQYITLEFNDKTNQIYDYLKTRFGIVETSVSASGKVTVGISAFKNEIDSTEHGTISVSIDADGTVATSAPTPTAASNTTNIATTAWVKTYGSTSGSNYLSSFSKASKGYYAFRNGLIINWGQTSFAADGTEVTFAKAFTSTNYQVVCTAHTTTSTNFVMGALVESKSATKFTAHGYKQGATATITNYWIAIGY